MPAKFGRGPMVVSKKGALQFYTVGQKMVMVVNLS